MRFEMAHLVTINSLGKQEKGKRGLQEDQQGALISEHKTFRSDEEILDKQGYEARHVQPQTHPN